MKILQVINDLETGGAQKLLADLVLELKKYPGIKTEILLSNKTGSSLEKKLENAGIKINELKTSLKSLKAIKKMIPYLKNADVVHVHLFPSNYIAAFANKRAHKPLIYTEHSTHNRRRDHKILRFPEKLIYKAYKHIGCISLATGENLTEWIGEKIASPRIKVIENGIDLTRYQFNTPIDGKQIFGREGKAVLMISRMTAAKDHPTIIRAFSEIENPELFLVFAGTGEREPELKKLVEELNLTERIMFLGNRDDIPQIIHASYIGIQMSNWEGFGLTAVEMMAAGKPVIATDIKGLREVVEGGGILVEPQDFKSLAREIERLARDENYYQEISNNCLRKSLVYSIEKTANEYVNLYKELMH